MAALAAATREVLKSTGVKGEDVAAIALDTTGSSVIPVGEGPGTDLHRWTTTICGAITARLPRPRRLRRRRTQLGFEGIEWCGGVYSHEWGFSKLLHWLRHNPDKRDKMVTALEHCDMVAATLAGLRRQAT